MFCIYIKEAATKQEFNRSRSLKFSQQQEQELEPESIFQEQDWIRSKKFWTPITSGWKCLTVAEIKQYTPVLTTRQAVTKNIQEVWISQYSM